ncbi:YggS family pyridoxal phosphate-dependent enzyme [Allohahella marinimesophila]|uniref:Pyridoxal phosphate homeostasis protein n=1 Tax=Allohahella marinimesophila TaxID=1054972 RepID=A0ABP7PAB8_9GAMM
MSIADKLQTVRAQIRNSTVAARRPEQAVTLLAVSKTMPAEDVAAAVRHGQRDFGENYVQEAVAKKAEVDRLLASDPEWARPVWHFIGPLQSNKTSEVAAHFDWFHTLDRLKIARRLSEQRPDDLPALNCCIQVNISHEDSKAGLLPDQHALNELATAVVGLPGLTLRGLMCIPAADLDEAGLADAFRRLRDMLAELREHLGHAHPEQAEKLDTLSMGMSADMSIAIAQGATIVRIGQAIFGARTPTHS